MDEDFVRRCSGKFLFEAFHSQNTYSIKVDKGDYAIRLQIRHDKKEYLDKLVDVPLLLSQKLGTAIVLDVYSSHSQAVIGGKKATVGHALSSCTLPLYIAPLSTDKFVVKSNNPAHYLTGYITYAKDELGKKVDIYPIKYVMYDSTKKASTKNVEKDKTKVEEYKEALRDLKTLWLSKIDVPAMVVGVYEELQSDFSDHLPSHTSFLQSVDPLEAKRQLPVLTEPEIRAQKEADLLNIINICNKVLTSNNPDTLLAYFAIKSDPRVDAIKIKSAMERQKNVFLECLCRKGIALCRLYLLLQAVPDEINSGTSHLSDIASSWKMLLKFVDLYDNKAVPSYVQYFSMWHASVNNHYGRLLKLLLKLQEEKNLREVDEKYIEICSLCGWEHLVRHLKNTLPSKYPVSYKPF